VIGGISGGNWRTEKRKRDCHMRGQMKVTDTNRCSTSKIMDECGQKVALLFYALQVLAEQQDILSIVEASASPIAPYLNHVKVVRCVSRNISNFLFCGLLYYSAVTLLHCIEVICAAKLDNPRWCPHLEVAVWFSECFK
jgi:hypothetical protein